MNIARLNINQIQIVRNPRKFVSESHIEEIAESIKQVGLRNPVIVQLQDSVYRLIGGQCRIEALKSIGETTVVAVVYEGLSDDDVSIMALADNLQHATLKLLDVSFEIKRIKDEYRLTHQQIANKLCKSQRWITDKIHIAERLSPKVQQLLSMRRLKHNQAIPLGRLSFGEQDWAVEEVMRSRMTTKQVRNHVGQLLGRGEFNLEFNIRKLIKESRHLIPMLRTIVDRYCNSNETLSTELVTELATIYHELLQVCGRIGMIVRNRSEELIK